MSNKILTCIVRNMLLLFVLSFSMTTLWGQTITVTGDPSDWPKVINKTPPASVTKVTFIHDATNTDDDQFTKGSQDNNVLSKKWFWNRGSTNDKGDIQNSCAALVNDTLYFFGDRTAINGTAQIGFWFFLDDVFPKPDGTFNGEHKVGDLLILSNFTNGGGNVDIRVYQFTGYSGNEAQFQLLTSSATGNVAKAAVNDQEYNVPGGVSNWVYQSKGGAAGKYVTGSFFEGFVDLKKLGSSLCFQQYIMETRNSAELSASQQDMVAGDFDVLPTVTLSVALKDGLTKSNTSSAACPDLYLLDALKTATAAVTATTTAATITWSFLHSDNTSVPNTEATFTPSTNTGTFEVKSASAFGKTYRIIVDASNGTNCNAKDTICINVSGSNPECVITGPNPVCPKSFNTYIYNPNLTNGADPLPTGFDAKWTLSDNSNNATPGTTDNTNSYDVTAGTACSTAYTVNLALTSKTGFGSKTCSLKVDVKVNSILSLTCPAPKAVACSASTARSNTGEPSAPDNGCGIKLGYVDTIYRTFFVTDACGNKQQCTQKITVDTCIITNTLPSARQSTETITSGPVLLTSPVNNQSQKPSIKDRPVIDQKATSAASLTTKELQVQAFPNPFSNTVNFRFVSPMSGRAILEVFNTQGQRVGIAFDGKIDAGIAKNVQFSTRLTNQALIYKLKVGDKTVRGTVLELKK